MIWSLASFLVGWWILSISKKIRVDKDLSIIKDRFVRQINPSLRGEYAAEIGSNIRWMGWYFLTFGVLFGLLLKETTLFLLGVIVLLYQIMATHKKFVRLSKRD